MRYMFKNDCDYLRISYLSYIGLFIFPIITVPLVGLMLAYSVTQQFTLNILKENNLIEMLTFIFLFIASIIGFRFLFIYFKNIKTYLWVILLIFIIGLLFIAMEEIAWGQQIFNFETPNNFKKLNAQQELTLHNLNGLQGKSEYFRLIFGVGGLLGFLVFKNNNNLSLLTLPKILYSYLIVITIVTLIDLYADFFPINKNYDIGLQRLSEYIEFLIGIVSLVYIIFLNNKLKNQ
ncbi:hypothetical protein UMM65_04890 [Aureibaculum sp. 2210JD6-5]|uniref:hypothetical protein n=1 Tax=Aureibaculum sp. 2210JD6-5 TaxID=3103957 RepID=UPI002AACDBAC|nr:hypothetical protein [Aureibaculum sp. 2210JD6-5]MDY7394566.1 hypothetical protein [Aureibaculum sp. 2210JD6-5]